MLVHPFISHSHRMVDKPMRCTAKAAEKASMRLRSAGTAGARAPEAAEVSPSAASTTQPAATTAAGARGGSSALDEYKLELIFFGESDHESDSKEVQSRDESESAKPEPANWALIML